MISEGTLVPPVSVRPTAHMSFEAMTAIPFK
jgi:hypothetical protein